MKAVEWVEVNLIHTPEGELHFKHNEECWQQAKVIEEQGKVEFAFRAYSEMLSTGKSFVDIVNSMRTFKSE